MAGITALIVTLLLILLPYYGFAAPYAAIVIDAKTGTILHAENEDTRLHPAGLTKLATLYEVFLLFRMEKSSSIIWSAFPEMLRKLLLLI